MAEIARSETTSVLIAKESTYGTPVSVTKDVGLVQNVNFTLNQNPITNFSLTSAELQDLDWGRVDIDGKIDVGFQHGRFIYYATGGTITHAQSTNDWKHTYALANTIPSFTMEVGHNLTTDAVTTYEGCKVRQLTISCGGTDQDIKMSVDLIAQSAVTSTSATSSVISSLSKLKGWQTSISTGTAGAESALGNVQAFEFTINNAQLGEMRNYKLSSRLADTADVMGRLMSGRFTVAIQNLTELKRFLGGAAASATSPTDTGVSPTLYGLVINAHNNVAAGSGRIELKIDMSGVLYSVVGSPTQLGNYTLLEVEFIAKTMDDFFTYDTIADTAFGDS